MDTQILQVREPYNYIHCNGSTALHVATLIVYEAKVNKSGEYTLETHSHPIVQYFDRPGGTVWNKAELRDCDVICSEADMTIPLKKFRKVLSHYPETYETQFEGKGISLNPIWKRDLEDIGIKVGWPMDKDGKEQEVFYIELEFSRGKNSKYVCKDRYCDFFFYIESDSKKDLWASLLHARDWYYWVFSEHTFRIEFVTDNHEFDDILSEINSRAWTKD
jgi:hypothetical protein